MTQISHVLQSKGSLIHTIPLDLPIANLVADLSTRRVGSLIVSNDGRHLDGLVTERDVVLGLARHGVQLLQMPVETIMATSVATCSPGDQVRDVMEQITTTRIRQVPVVDDGELCGIVSVGDLLKQYLEDSVAEAYFTSHRMV